MHPVGFTMEIHRDARTCDRQMSRDCLGYRSSKNTKTCGRWTENTVHEYWIFRNVYTVVNISCCNEDLYALWDLALCGMWRFVGCGALWDVALCGMWPFVRCGALWDVALCEM